MKFSKIHFLFSFLILLTYGCGEKSIIKVDTKSRTFAEAYGDGQYVIRPLVLPLSDHAIESFDSPVQRVDFVAGGFARMLMDVGVAMGLGRNLLTLTQPLPEMDGIDEFIKGAKIKRLFFYIEPTEGGSRLTNLYRRLIRGQHDTNFKFLDKIAIKATAVQQNTFTTWYPEFAYKGLKKKEFTPLQALFENGNNRRNVEENTHDASKVLVKYDGQNKDKYLNKDRGTIYILRTNEPSKTKRFLSKNPELKDSIKQIQMLNNTLIVELTKDRNSSEKFKVALPENPSILTEYDIDLVEECTPETCLDIKVEDVDLMELLTKGNALKIDAYINAKKAPQSFQLKGFLEFELKLKIDF